MALLPKFVWPTGRTCLLLSSKLALGLLLFLGLGVTPCEAQGPSADGIYYSRLTQFRIPFQIDPGDRRVHQVLLHVSRDQGRSYEQVAAAGPEERGFNFKADRDGSYWFAVQTQDLERRLYPANLDQVEPGLKVIVDTIAPSITLNAAAPTRAEEVAIEWDIRDDTLDLSTLRLDYRTPGQPWQPRGIQRVAHGRLSWDPGTDEKLEIRLQLKDRAGNMGEAVATTRRGLAPGAQPGTPKAPSTGADSTRMHYADNVRKVNSKRISLNYKIDDVGPSDISIIEIWVTGEGKSWQRYPKDASRQPPFIVDVEGEGRYGFTLVARSGVGLGERPPQPGDPPQIWVEVDLTKPEVQILGVEVGKGIETGNLTILWKATDRNMSRQPIAISYATDPKGPWLPVPNATNLDNDGRYVWRMGESVPYQFYVRVEAIDEAGNIGLAETPQTVKVDLKLPKARVIGVEPARR